jgi:hypothetical protein
VAQPGGAQPEHEGVREVINDLWILCRDYAKQETIDPLKMLGQFLGFGLAGAILLCLGLGFGALAVIRALQTEIDAFSGNLNWVPYLAGLAFTGLAAFVSYRTIRSPFRTKEVQP